VKGTDEMEREHVEDHEIEQVLKLPADHPRRRHLETCPKCRSALALFRAFDAGGPAPAGARPGEARRRLSEIVERELGDTPPRRIVLAPRRWFTSGWALATAATLVVGAGLAWNALRPPSPVPAGNAWRGAAAAAPALEEAAVAPDGRLVLRWRAVEGAESYDVRVFSSALREVWHATVTDTTASLDPTGLPGGPGAAAWWRVTALSGGRERARSRTGAIPLR